MANKTPVSNPELRKQKAHARAQARRDRATPQYLRDKINGSATIGRIRKRCRDIEALVEQPDEDTHDRLRAHEIVLKTELALLNKVLPSLKAVELSGVGGTSLEIGIVRFSDIPTEQSEGT